MAEFIPPEERRLDWVPRFDARSREYPVRTLFRGSEPQNMTWRTPAIPLDQGREGACVGFGWTHEALTTPVAVDFDRVKANVPRSPTVFAHHVYKLAQRIDEWEGEDYEGTSVLAGAKMMKEAGLLREYRWGFSINDLALALTNVGPAVIGIPWFESMYEAPGGHVTVYGQEVGGHCILVTRYRKAGVIYPDEPAYGLFNSWGPGWGNQGHAWIGESALARLLANGETCIPYRRSYGR